MVESRYDYYTYLFLDLDDLNIKAFTDKVKCIVGVKKKYNPLNDND